jgi:hypothetical protein
MKKLFQIEAIKTIGLPSFRAIIALHAILFLLIAILASNINLNIQGITVSKLLHFPHVWATFAWISSWFNLLLGIIIVVLISNELQFRTFRKQIIDGLTRNELLISKLIVIVIIALYTMLLVFISGLVFGIIKSPSYTISDVLEGLPILPVLFTQALAYMLLAMLITLIFRSTAFSIVSFILFFFPVEPIIRAFLPDSVDRFFPAKVISNLTPMPDFFSITLGDMVKIQGESTPDLYSMGLAQESLPLIATVAIAIAYSLIFIFISKLIVDSKNF